MLHWFRGRDWLVFFLEGEADQWWDSIRIDEQKLNGTWNEFEANTDHQFISNTKRSIKRIELMILVQGEITITECEN